RETPGGAATRERAVASAKTQAPAGDDPRLDGAVDTDYRRCGSLRRHRGRARRVRGARGDRGYLGPLGPALAAVPIEPFLGHLGRRGSGAGLNVGAGRKLEPEVVEHAARRSRLVGDQILEA